MNRPSLDQKLWLTGAFLFISLAALPNSRAERAQDGRQAEKGQALTEVERVDFEFKQSQLILLTVSTRNVERVLSAEKRLILRTRAAEARNEIRPQARSRAIEKIRAHHEFVLKKILGDKTYAAYDQALKERAAEQKIVTDFHEHRARNRIEGAAPELEARRTGFITNTHFQASSEGSDGW